MGARPPLSPLSQVSPAGKASAKKRRWMLPWVVLSALVLVFSAYIVVIDQDLTAILVGIVIVLILYVLFSYIGRLAVKP